MNRTEKYAGIFPSLYACYDSFGKIDPAAQRRLCRHLLESGANGIYVCGSAGECMLLTAGERMLILECALAECGGSIPVIAHVACPTTEESRRLAAHAASAGADAVAALPPFFYKVSDRENAEYWKAISAAAPGVDFFIYDIPELSANRLTDSLLREMAQCEDLAGVKASSETAGDVERFGEILGDNRCVMCGSDGLLCAELALGACGGIGGTYAALIEHFSALYRSFSSGDVRAATEHQRLIWHFLETAEKRQCSIYALMKEIIRTKYGIDAGSVRPPLAPVTDADRALAAVLAKM